MESKFCTFCVKAINTGNFTIVQDVAEMVQKCIPEMDIEMVEEALICDACQKDLNEFFNFILDCTTTEEKLIRYDKDTHAQVDLTDVLKSVLKIEIGDINTVRHSGLETKNQQYWFQSKYTSDCECDNPSKDQAIFERETHIWQMLGNEKLKIRTLFKRKLCCYNTKQEVQLLDLKICRSKLCDDKSNQKPKLKGYNMSRKNQDEVAMFWCGLCTYGSKYKANLKTHMITHKSPEDIRLFKCKFCSYEGKMKGNLKKHMLTHKIQKDIPWFRCDLCSYETKYKSNLKTHMLTHKNTEEITMFKCELCSYEAKQNKHLKRHKLTHKRRNKDV